MIKNKLSSTQSLCGQMLCILPNWELFKEQFAVGALPLSKRRIFVILGFVAGMGKGFELKRKTMRRN